MCGAAEHPGITGAAEGPLKKTCSSVRLCQGAQQEKAHA